MRNKYFFQYFIIFIVSTFTCSKGLSQACVFIDEPDILERPIVADIPYQSFNLAEGDYSVWFGCEDLCQESFTKSIIIVEGFDPSGSPFIAPVFFTGVPQVASTWYQSKRLAPCDFWNA